MHRCRRCSRRLGRYPAGPTRPQGIEGTDPISGPWKGPRTGTGIHLERYRDRAYLRVRCKCGRSEKIRLRSTTTGYAIADQKLAGQVAGRDIYL